MPVSRTKVPETSTGDRAGKNRDAVSGARDETAEARLETAANRDQAAAIRDREAHHRDDLARLRDLEGNGRRDNRAHLRAVKTRAADSTATTSNAEHDRVESAADRDSATDRALAVFDPDEATEDRRRAAADRHASANDRARAVVARAEAVREHADAISVLVNAASTLAVLTAEELQAAQRLASIVDAAEDAIISKDLEGTILSWNASAERVYGYSAIEAVGQSVRMLLPPGRPPELPGIFSRFARGERVAQFQSKRRRKDGAVIDVSLTVSPIRGYESDIVGATTISRDITVELATQAKHDEQLRQSQKLESIGSLAGGIAHDFNNILTVIRGNTEILLNTPGAKAYRERLSGIDKAAELAAALTGQLLAFSRQQMLRPEIVDVNCVAGTTCDLLERLLGESVVLDRQLWADPALTLIDPTQLQQIVLNLCVNARDAMPSGGTLLVSTQSVAVDESYAMSHVELSPGSYVVLEVADTGLGIDPDMRARIFDPFFTTKSEGTGLGLSTVFGAIKQSGGTISVYSELGTGTSFKVYLPQSNSENVRTARTEIQVTEGRSATILLVEDFDVLRALGVQMLEAIGHTVLAAANGTEALAVFEEHQDEIDLLFTDLMMPQISGKELADRLLAARPELRVLFTSGYPAQTAIDDISSKQVAFIQKPYTMTELSRQIHAILDGRSNAEHSIRRAPNP